MTWYFNNNGAADGPYDDEAMASLVAQKRIQAQTLIWHPGVDLWQEISSFSPSWWKSAMASNAAGSNEKPVKADTPTTTRNLVPMAPRADNSPKVQTSFLKRLFGWGKK
ncbi:DUF4339 domain-containing protein [Prosthecobacter sp. SYSU 5D2]|uniref:DUF4339 domain-containing protein n=1 Tax=Prosthecobacter sp. SYSU 5D2 TaxID=3134134 RepID=UPI0031FE7D64